MPIYTIKYFFDGEGEVSIKAKSKKDAENKFYSGDDWQGFESENGENYTVSLIEKE